MNSSALQFVASSPRGLSDLLARELTSFGAVNVRERSTGVSFEGSLETGYRACLESRTANRVLLVIGEHFAGTADEYYAFARTVDWTAHIAPGATIACDFSGTHPTITHSQFGALKLKDAIVDSLRESTGERPDVARERPNVRVHAHSRGTMITLAIDLSGDSLHRRGYRGGAGEAPLKENIAAGILLRAGWPAFPQLFDPMCGSGTFVIEAALIAADKAPGLTRDYFGFLGWRGHDAEVWRRVRSAAEARVRVYSSTPRGSARADAAAANTLDADARTAVPTIRGADSAASAAANSLDVDARIAAPTIRGADSAATAAANSHGAGSGGVPTLRGADHDAHAIRAARTNAENAGIAEWVSFAIAPLSEASTSSSAAATAEPGSPDESARTADAGLLVTNPPYGVRLDDREAALRIHKELGQVLRERFGGWQAAILTGAPDLGLELGIRAYRTHTMWNGALECRLLRLKVESTSFRERAEPGMAHFDAGLKDSTGAKMFGNRLGKNRKRFAKWAKSKGITCYRMYDADMPEYSFAIDVYHTVEDGLDWLYVQEYAAPEEIEAQAVRRRRGEAFSVLTEVTGVPNERIRVRTRRKQSEGSQYGKVNDRSHFHTVEEGGLRFYVNFEDYLDTGLFLDHRLTRARLREGAKGKRFLNLFAYTGSATVYAASGGAAASTTVDLSRTYLDWAQRNLELNNLGTRYHTFVQADCRTWLAQAAARGERFDLIFLDPPTFSNSKRMEGVLDLRRDHPALIDECVRVLAAEGLLVFSTNAQKFKLDPDVAARYAIRDISAETLPLDFERNARIHSCYEIRIKR